ncbi:hypothetical protein FQR65_LT18637 [Abscondita terminalis]|nr:hypothetical protein FQR65_LT18637 [Abscondita terminalis]
MKGAKMQELEKEVSEQETLNEDVVEKDFKTKSKRKTFFGVIFSYLKTNPLIGILLVIMAIASSGSTVAGPKIVQQIMTVVMGGEKTVVFATGVFTFLSQLISGFMGRNIEIFLRNKSLERLVKQDMSYYSDKKIGEILTKIVSDTQIIGDQAQQVPVTLLTAIFTFFGSLAMMFTIDVNLTIVVIVTMVIILVSLFSTFGIMRRMIMKVRNVITDINGDVTDRISTVRLIKASGTEEYETQRFKDIHQKYFTASKKAVTMQSVIITVLIVGISSIQVVIVVSAAIMYGDDQSKFATLLPSFISGVGTMIGPVMQLIRVVVGIIQASSSSERVNQIIESTPRFNPHYKEGEGIYIDKIYGDIHFKELSFSYPEKPEKEILPKFSFTFKEGKSYAFVGETGSGKSTISKLLLRFYDPTEGDVLINNDINLKDVHLSSFLNHVGYVEQEPQIIFGNVFDNIRYGRFNASDDEVLEAAKKAELHDLVQS